MITRHPLGGNLLGVYLIGSKSGYRQTGLPDNYQNQRWRYLLSHRTLPVQASWYVIACRQVTVTEKGGWHIFRKDQFFLIIHHAHHCHGHRSPSLPSRERHVPSGISSIAKYRSSILVVISLFSHKTNFGMAHVKQIVGHLVTAHQIVGYHAVAGFPSSCGIQADPGELPRLLPEIPHILSLKLSHYDQAVCLFLKEHLGKFLPFLHFDADHLQHGETGSGDRLPWRSPGEVSNRRTGSRTHNDPQQ